MTHILGIREFVNIPGDQVYELPPLIRKEWPRETTDELFNQAQFVVAEAEVAQGHDKKYENPD